MQEQDHGHHRAYIGSFTSAGGRGITTAAVDPGTGALTPTGATDALGDPSYLAVDPQAGVLYAVGEGTPGTAAAFGLTAQGPVPLGAAVPVAGDGPTHLCLAGRWLLTANYGSGSVSVLARGAGGALAGPARVLVHEGAGPDPERQAAPHAHQVVAAPGGRWVLGVDLGTDALRVCTLDPETGVLRLHAEAALRPGSGPRHLAFHPGGRVLYVLNELAPTVTVCRWDGETGAVEVVEEVPVAAEGAPASVRAYPSALVASPDGRHLWAAVRGTDVIAVLALDAGGERVRPAGTADCGGHWPRDLALDPSGRRLYAANERSGDVTWFDVDPATGMPSRAGSTAVPAASCVVFART
ncbi:lactonase family protein [Streptomyces bambusae]|uniref:lactonase family protein n=1 Tax=Streptomyces bambusae TaxID=1550616 RepID=UPI001CFD5343|nr:lactonase family protein [Streptomyces bambusae]MCB5166672.1 lactonase family protein [Streptomyces bambusae]